MTQKRFVSMIGALVVILGAVALITGCPQANDSKDKAVYVGKSVYGETTITHTVTFKADGTWIVHSGTQTQSSVAMQGTYTGDPSKDGTVTITVTKQLNDEGTTLVDVAGEDVVLDIKDGKCTVMGIKYTRQ